MSGGLLSLEFQEADRLLLLVLAEAGSAAGVVRSLMVVGEAVGPGSDATG